MILVKGPAPVSSKNAVVEYETAQKVAQRDGFKAMFEGKGVANSAITAGATTVVFHEVNGEVLPIKLVNLTYMENGKQEGSYLVEGFDKNGIYVEGRIGLSHDQYNEHDNPYSDMYYSCDCNCVDLGNNPVHISRGGDAEHIFEQDGARFIGPVSREGSFDPNNIAKGDYNPSEILLDFSKAYAYAQQAGAVTTVTEVAEDMAE